MKALGFSILQGRLRHLARPLAAGLVGVMVSWLLWPLDTEGLDALRQEVVQLQAQEHAQRKGLPSAPTGSAARQQEPMPDEPDLAEGTMVWPWLQQRLRSQGLQVQVLRPQAVSRPQALPEQAVAMRLQGRWRDWLAFQEALNRHAPWWVIDQWQVVPVGPQSDEVRIELQARLGFRPSALQAERTVPRVWPEWPVLGDGRPMPGADLFAQAHTPLATASTAEAQAPLPADPRDWPVHALRLLGVWQQAGTAHAVLGDGLNQVVVKQGQRIGREAYRVRRIGDGQVELGAAGATGQVLRLTLQGEPP